VFLSAVESASGARLVSIRSSAYPRFVSSLSERDASALLAFVSDLADFDEPMPFPPQLLVRLQDLIASDQVSYSELDPIEQAVILGVVHRPDGHDLVVTKDEETEEARAGGMGLWWKLRPTHPVCGYRSRTGDWTTARKVSDFATLREFRSTPIYDAFYRGDVDYWLDVGLAAEPARTRIFLFTRRGGPDFDEHDRLVAQLVQPHLAERAEAVEAALRGADALAAVDGGEEPDRVVLCSASGVVEFASANARALLERYGLVEEQRLPAAVLRRRALQLARGDHRLHVRIARTDNLYVLILDEQDLRLEKLSAREREVVGLAGCGKANDAIAFELGIARATVVKHLEHAYRKLGVQNRTAAAAFLNNN